MSLEQVWVDESVSLTRWSQWRQQSLATGQIHHAFHYQSLQQSRLWLEVFRRHSPAAGAQTVTTIYEQQALTVAEKFRAQTVQVISLGCGDGRKDLLLIRALLAVGARVLWSPQDISLSLVLLTIESARDLSLLGIKPVVADLLALPDLARTFDQLESALPRIITFYGLVPNFEPDFLLDCWSKLVRARDYLLVSANLSPARDESKEAYLEATERIKPQYDNPETERWLRAILQDWGIEAHLENYRLRLESRHDLLRLVAAMDWRETTNLAWEDQVISRRPGDNLRLFFSYRYTPARFRKLAQKAGLTTQGEWIASSRDEGVWSLVPS